MSNATPDLRLLSQSPSVTAVSVGPDVLLWQSVACGVIGSVSY